MRSVSIVIPNWNGRELLERFFASVVEAAERYRSVSNAEVEIIVVDDASTDDSRSWLVSNYASHEFVRTIELERNVGFLRAVNRGFDSARHPIVFLLNNDVMIEPDCIAPLAEHFKDDDVFSVCCHAMRIGTDRLDGGGKIGSFKRGSWRVYLNYDVLPSGRSRELISFFGSGGYTAYDREKWTELWGFQDCFAPIYWEDVEISYRAWKRGWKVLYEPRSIVKHLGSATMGRDGRNKKVTVIAERNRLLMMWINLHDSRMIAAHLGWLVLKFIAAIATFNLNFIRSTFKATGSIRSVRRLRGIEKRAAKISDRQIQEMFKVFISGTFVNILRTAEDEVSFAVRKSIDAAKVNER